MEEKFSNLTSYVDVLIAAKNEIIVILIGRTMQPITLTLASRQTIVFTNYRIFSKLLPCQVNFWIYISDFKTNLSKI